MCEARHYDETRSVTYEDVRTSTLKRTRSQNSAKMRGVFIGHFAVGFAAKRAAPRLSLAVLFAAAQFADLLWPLLVAVGISRLGFGAFPSVVMPVKECRTW